MRLLLLPFMFIYELITTNRAKSTILIIASVLLYLSYSVDQETTYTKNVYANFVDADKKSQYVVSSDNSNFSIKEFDKPLKITNNTITYEEMSDARVLLLVVFWICAIFLIIAFFMGLGDDDEISWEFKDCWQRSISSLIYCELEDGKYYYMALGRLIYISDRLFERHRNGCLAESLNIYKLRDLMNYPKYKTKTDRRNSKLDKLGI